MSDILEELKRIGTNTGDALDRFLNDEEMYLKYVHDFPEEQSMPNLIAAVEKKDYVQAEHSVHALKGIVNNLGFTKLADATVDMLAELRDQNIDDALIEYENVKTQYDKYCAVIQQWRSEQ